MVQKSEWIVKSADIVIVGGGISGMWLSRRLQNLGFSTIIIERNECGSEQTLNSQGIIHGGTKYTLQGMLTKVADIVGEMPNRWRESLDGNIDLSIKGTEILSETQYLISTGNLSSNLATFFASQVMRSRVQAVENKDEFPTVLQNPDFKGNVYKLNEFVINTKSLLENLYVDTPVLQCKFKSEYIRWDDDKSALGITVPNQKLNISSQAIIFATGEGNEEIISGFPEHIHVPETQVRPLHMVYLRRNELPELFAHYIGIGTKPRLTISTHKVGSETVWYLGGALAEEGVGKSTSEQINQAQKEIKELLPWVDITGSKWDAFLINRAETKQRNLSLPDKAQMSTYKNTSLVWPTKLALVPNLGDQVVEWIDKKLKIQPKYPNIDLEAMERAPIGQPHWEI